MNGYNYKVYYARVPLHKITNLCDPIYISQFVDAFGGRDEYYHKDNHKLKCKLKSTYKKEFNKELGHYKKLKEQALENMGFENPILLTLDDKPHMVNLDKYPKNLIDSIPLIAKPFFLERLGGSRYIAAKDAGLYYIDAIVTDWTGRLEELVAGKCIEIKTPGDAYAFFGHLDRSAETSKIKFSDKGCILTAMTHFHIDKKINGEDYNHNHQVVIRQEIIQRCIKIGKEFIKRSKL